MKLNGMRVGVVGGSLGGLSAALVLARLGAEVQIFERGARGFETRGGGLSIDLALTKSLMAREDPPPHLMVTRRWIWKQGQETEQTIAMPVTAYGALWAWLRAGLPADALRFGQVVERAEPTPDGRRASLWLANGEQLDFDLIVCADGGTSAARAWVQAEALQRQYAGYVLWRGLIPMAALNPAFTTGLMERFHIAEAGSLQFLSYSIPPPSGDTSPGARLLNWGWYYPLPESQLSELRRRGAGELVPHVVGRDIASPEWMERLHREGQQLWPAQLLNVLNTTLEQGGIAPHPIYEYFPDRAVRGRLVLVGDAAHLASPITGSGSRMAMEDAVGLEQAILGSNTLDEALAVYAEMRLEEARGIVQFGRAYMAERRIIPPKR